MGQILPAPACFHFAPGCRSENIALASMKKNKNKAYKYEYRFYFMVQFIFFHDMLSCLVIINIIVVILAVNTYFYKILIFRIKKLQKTYIDFFLKYAGQLAESQINIYEQLIEFINSQV